MLDVEMECERLEGVARDERERAVKLVKKIVVCEVFDV